MCKTNAIVDQTYKTNAIGNASPNNWVCGAILKIYVLHWYIVWIVFVVTVTLINSNSSRNHETNGCAISVNMFTWEWVAMFTSQLEYMATAKCCSCLQHRKDTWLLCRRVMFTIWRSKRLLAEWKMFTGRSSKMFTIGEGMYTGWELKLFTENVKWTFAE